VRYLLGSGYYHPDPENDEFVSRWARIFERYANPKPTIRIIIGVNNSRIRFDEKNRDNMLACESRALILMKYEQIVLQGNNGHVGQLISGEKKNKFCGWSMAFLTGAMIAYQNETDYIWLEQDCLAFGPWVERTYADMGDGDMVFGHKMKTAPFMPCSQSLVLVRHSFIPEMVSAYLGMGTDNDVTNLPEAKFQKLEDQFGDRIRRLSFGCDRERPIPYDDEVFYAQKLTDEELETLKQKGKL